MTSRSVLPLQDEPNEEEGTHAFGSEEATASPGPSSLSMLYSYPISLSANMVSGDIIRLNVGGVLYTTTKATLVSRGSNFFGPLLDGHFGRLQDPSGAYFIDRNGRLFAPLLDYLRQGVLTLPVDVKIEQIVEEAKFYSIDILPGLCGDLKEGLYTSSNWILYFERDPDHPWIFGITGTCYTRCIFQDQTLLSFSLPTPPLPPLHSDSPLSPSCSPNFLHSQLTFTQHFSCRVATLFVSLWRSTSHSSTF